ncbi:MAG TPA: biotin/lipoyl-containing protein [Vicinamibacterales bacterium]|nr:biotin/lipoyl-containing protein [Vicinamibacterales bacterium]
MNFDVTVGGRPWKVAIEPATRPGQFTVAVASRTRVLDVSWIDKDTLSLVDGSVVREVRLDRRSSGSFGVAIGGRTFEAVVAVKRRGQRRHPESCAASAAVKAAMPGRVVRVLVAVGDRVIARQPVMIVEAMKMENELRAAVDGVVKEINVPEGAAVDAGAVLIVIE